MRKWPLVSLTGTTKIEELVIGQCVPCLITLTGYPLSLPSETLPCFPLHQPALFATYNYSLPPSKSFLPSPKPHRLRHSTPLLRSLHLTRGLMVSAHPPCALASNSATSLLLPSTLLHSLCLHPEPYPGPSVSRHLTVRSEHVPFPPFSTCHRDLLPLSPAFPLLVCHMIHMPAPPSPSDSHCACQADVTFYLLDT